MTGTGNTPSHERPFVTNAKPKATTSGVTEVKVKAGNKLKHKRISPTNVVTRPFEGNGATGTRSNFSKFCEVSHQQSFRVPIVAFVFVKRRQRTNEMKYFVLCGLLCHPQLNLGDLLWISQINKVSAQAQIFNSKLFGDASEVTVRRTTKLNHARSNRLLFKLSTCSRRQRKSRFGNEENNF